MATSTGFEYLKDADYIDRELEIWLSVNLTTPYAWSRHLADRAGEEPAVRYRGRDMGVTDTSTLFERYCRGLLVRPVYYTGSHPHVERRLIENRSYDSTAPSHFLGELTKTEEGCQFLREKGIVSGLADIVRLHGLEPSNDAVLTSLKCALWALVRAGQQTSGTTMGLILSGQYRIHRWRSSLPRG